MSIAFNLLFGSWRPRSLPLRRLQFCLWVVNINDAFITCDDVQEESGVVYHSFLQFLTDRYSTVFLIVGQLSRHKLRCNSMHVQLFCENSLTRSITNSNLCTEIVYGTTTILVDSRPYLFHFWGVVAVLGRTDRSSLAVEVLPFLKRPNHSKFRLRLMHKSPKVSLPVLPNLTQNLMHTLCSSTSAIPLISENRRRLMQYTYKDTCNNQTLPHPTTPLSTFSHKTPPQHTLAENSWTISDLSVMSIALGLLDTPSSITIIARKLSKPEDDRYRLKHVIFPLLINTII